MSQQVSLPPKEQVNQTILLLCEMSERLMSSHADIHAQIERDIDLKTHETLRTLLGSEQAMHDQFAASIENIRREIQ